MRSGATAYRAYTEVVWSGQGNEALWLMKSEVGCFMNSKSEFNKREVPTTGILDDKGT